jgi:hypothetical protein
MSTKHLLLLAASLTAGGLLEAVLHYLDYVQVYHDWFA